MIKNRKLFTAETVCTPFGQHVFLSFTTACFLFWVHARVSLLLCVSFFSH